MLWDLRITKENNTRLFLLYLNFLLVVIRSEFEHTSDLIHFKYTDQTFSFAKSSLIAGLFFTHPQVWDPS